MVGSKEGFLLLDIWGLLCQCQGPLEDPLVGQSVSANDRSVGFSSWLRDSLIPGEFAVKENMEMSRQPMDVIETAHHIRPWQRFSSVMRLVLSTLTDREESNSYRIGCWKKSMTLKFTSFDVVLRLCSVPHFMYLILEEGSSFSFASSDKTRT